MIFVNFTVGCLSLMIKWFSSFVISYMSPLKKFFINMMSLLKLSSKSACSCPDQGFLEFLKGQPGTYRGPCSPVTPRLRLLHCLQGMLQSLPPPIPTPLQLLVPHMIFKWNEDSHKLMKFITLFVHVCFMKFISYLYLYVSWNLLFYLYMNYVCLIKFCHMH